MELDREKMNYELNQLDKHFVIDTENSEIGRSILKELEDVKYIEWDEKDELMTDNDSKKSGPKIIDLKWNGENDISLSLHDNENDYIFREKFEEKSSTFIENSMPSIFDKKGHETSAIFNFEKTIHFVEMKIGHLLFSPPILNHINAEIRGIISNCYYPVKGDSGGLIKVKVPSNTWRDGDHLKIYRDRKPKTNQIDEIKFFECFDLFQHSLTMYSIMPTEENLKDFEFSKIQLEKYQDELKNFFYITPDKEIIPSFLKYFTALCNETLLKFFNCSDEKFPELLYYIAHLHNSFILVQPHMKANGRTIRLICNIILIRCGRDPFWFNDLNDFMNYEYIIAFCVRNRNKDFVKPFYLFLCKIYSISNPIQPKRVENLPKTSKSLQKFY